MVDFQEQNIRLWLPETSLFADELIHSSINIDDYLSNDKANSKLDQASLSASGLEWFDENVDLSILPAPNDLLDHRNETKLSMEDDTAAFLGWLDGGFNLPQFGILSNEEIDLAKEFDLQNLVAEEDATSEIFDTHLASPRCNTLQVNSPAFFPSQSPASPYSDISDTPDESVSSAVLESSTVSSVSDFTTNSLGSPQVQVLVCNNVENSSSSEPALSLEEVSRSVRKRKFVSNGESIPKVKVIISDNVPRVSTPRPKDRRERKKVQNKEAAARYRIKKRMEEQVLSDEVSDLETTQQELKKKHNDLQSEIKYLKSLMCEILIKKGVMK